MPTDDIFTHTKKSLLRRHFINAHQSRTHDFQHPIKIVMEGEVEADAGVANDIGETTYSSEPPTGPNLAQRGTSQGGLGVRFAAEGCP